MMTPEERHELVLEITHALACSQPAPQLTDEEVQYVKLAIQREAQSIELRKAIIEKTITGLIWLALLGLGGIFLEWAKAHGFKP
jgi:hypothetical protein